MCPVIWRSFKEVQRSLVEVNIAVKSRLKTGLKLQSVKLPIFHFRRTKGRFTLLWHTVGSDERHCAV